MPGLKLKKMIINKIQEELIKQSELNKQFLKKYNGKKRRIIIKTS